jgi:hypothetical protein
MEKSGGRKSHATVPLNKKLYLRVDVDNTKDTQNQHLRVKCKNIPTENDLCAHETGDKKAVAKLSKIF